MNYALTALMTACLLANLTLLAVDSWRHNQTLAYVNAICVVVSAVGLWAAGVTWGLRR